MFFLNVKETDIYMNSPCRAQKRQDYSVSALMRQRVDDELMTAR